MRHPNHRKYRSMRKRKRGPLFIRFLFAFLFITILISGTVEVFRFIVNLITNQSQTSMPMDGHMMLATRSFLLPGVMILLFLFGITMIISRTLRQFATPLDDVIEAAEAVAEGDLSVRVVERGGAGIHQLIQTFNRMVGELQQADTQRRNLTADIAHELRTPLHILQGHIEAIIDGVYQADETTLNNMLNESHTLTRMIDDLQTLSMAESGQLKLTFERVDICELLKDVGTSFTPLAETQNIQLTINCSSPLLFLGDPGRLDQIFSNLIVNALRHTPENGQVQLSAITTQDEIEILIKDSGEGIPPEALPAIFDRFYRVDSARTRDKGGAGLGLAITKQLVELHAGTITVESTLGEGTTFRLVFPLNA